MVFDECVDHDAGVVCRGFEIGKVVLLCFVMRWFSIIPLGISFR